MRLTRLKCQICSFWYRPVEPLSSHCPACGAMPIQVTKTRYRYFHLLDTDARMIEIVSAVPRYSIGSANAVRIAQVLVDGIERPIEKPRLNRGN